MIAFRTSILKEILSDPVWSKVVEDAWQEYVRTGKTDKLREILKDYCAVKELKVKEIN